MLFVLAGTNWEGDVYRAKELTSSDASEEEHEQREKSATEECHFLITLAGR